MAPRITIHRRAVGATLATVILTAGLSLAAMSLVGVDLGGNTAAPAEKSNWIGGLLLTDDRDKLSVCVNVVGLTDKAAAEASAVANLDAALAEVKKNPKWESEVERTPLAANTEVLAGCPEGALTSAAPTPGKFGERVWNTPGRIVEGASPHLLHVYVLPEEEILRIVGPSQNYHGAVEERLCYGDACYVVTQALYYSPSDLDNIELVAREMEFALSLRSEPW